MNTFCQIRAGEERRAPGGGTSAVHEQTLAGSVNLRVGVDSVNFRAGQV